MIQICFHVEFVALCLELLNSKGLAFLSILQNSDHLLRSHCLPYVALGTVSASSTPKSAWHLHHHTTGETDVWKVRVAQSLVVGPRMWTQNVLTSHLGLIT